MNIFIFYSKDELNSIEIGDVIRTKEKSAIVLSIIKNNMNLDRFNVPDKFIVDKEFVQFNCVIDVIPLNEKQYELL